MLWCEELTDFIVTSETCRLMTKEMAEIKQKAF
jgi:hypothetical protein